MTHDLSRWRLGGVSWRDGRRVSRFPSKPCRPPVVGLLVLVLGFWLCRPAVAQTPRVLAARFAQVDARLPVLEALLARCRTRGIPTAYEFVDYTTIKNFLPWGRADLAAGDTAHADSIAVTLTALALTATANLRAYLAGTRRPRAAPLYVTQHPAVAGASFMGDVRWPDGRVEHERPLFFVGYGHFGQVRRDIPQFSAYGTNIIQIEVWPSRIIYPPTHPGRPWDDSTGAITGDLQHVLDSAAKYNVAVNLLLSPHYFPPWALDMWPALRNDHGDGFIRFNVMAPRAHALLAAYLRTLLPLIDGTPALHSVTLSNEPRYDAEEDTADHAAWHTYLGRQYGTVARCNAVYGTAYTAFAQIPIPTQVTRTPVYYDWMTFKEARFAAWHEWMTALIHELAPELPVHVKLLSWTVHDLTAGIDPERFAEFSQLSGNDNWVDAAGFLGYEQFYDLLGSLKVAPIFDSEAHLLPGSAAQVRSALWQGAIHGRNAATLWVWERPGPDLDHPLLTRPDVVAAVGQTTLDLNRLARAVTSLQTAPATVALLYSRPSVLYDPDYATLLARAYRALTYSGVKVTLISETQVAAGGLRADKLVLLPGAIHVHAATVRGIGRFAASGGIVVALGAHVLTRDEHDQPLPAASRIVALAHALRLDTAITAGALRQALAGPLARLGLTRVQLRDATTHQLAAHVEWRAVQSHGSWLIDMLAPMVHPPAVVLTVDGRAITRAYDRVGDTTVVGRPLHLAGWTPYLFTVPVSAAAR